MAKQNASQKGRFRCRGDHRKPENAEPTVEELLNDPIARMLMARDQLQSEQVWAYVNDARRGLRGRETQEREAVAITPK
jgi:hypothetical protein